MKKFLLILAGAGLLFSSLAFAQEEEEESPFSFENEFGTSVVTVTPESAGFAGIYNQTTVELSTDNVEAAVQARVVLGVDDDGKPVNFSFSADDFDWSIAYTPIDLLTLGLHTQNEFDAAYIYTIDDFMGVGRLGSDGFSLSVKPIEGLTIGASVPFGFEDDANSFEDGFKTVAGISYEMEDMFTAGASVMDLGLESLRFGVFGSLNMVENLVVRAGYTYKAQDDLVVDGDNVINLNAVYGFGDGEAAVDFVTNTDDSFYAGAYVNYGFGNITPGLTVAATSNYSSITSGEFVFTPEVTIATESFGEVSVKSEITFSDGNFASVDFPVAWVYSF